MHKNSPEDFALVDGDPPASPAAVAASSLRPGAFRRHAPATPSSPCIGGARFVGGLGANALTIPAIDPHSKQPELKHAAVRVEPFAVRWRAHHRRRHPGIAARRRVLATAVRLCRAFSGVEGPKYLSALSPPPAPHRIPRPSRPRAALRLPRRHPPQRLRTRRLRPLQSVRVRHPLRRRRRRDARQTQKEPKCGTSCGSCVLELRRLIAA